MTPGSATELKIFLIENLVRDDKSHPENALRIRINRAMKEFIQESWTEYMTMRKESMLTRNKEIIKLRSDGKKMREISEKFSLSTATIKVILDTAERRRLLAERLISKRND